MSDIFKDLVVCRRKDCEFYCTLKQNNCEVLRKVYDNDFKCKFYKEKKGMTEFRFLESEDK